MLAAAYVIGTLVIFTLSYFWLSECLERASHGKLVDDGQDRRRAGVERRGKDFTAELLSDRRKRQRRAS